MHNARSSTVCATKATSPVGGGGVGVQPWRRYGHGGEYGPGGGVWSRKGMALSPVERAAPYSFYNTKVN